MKDEIKEILEDVKRHLDYVEATKQCSIRDNEMKAMYDYITNLEKKYENAVADYEMEKAKNNIIVKLGDTYKSRIDKAIEYIHNHQLVFELSSKKQIQYWFDMFYKDLLDILNGGDE